MKVWFKRTFAGGKDGGYLKLTKESVYEIRKSQEQNKSKGYLPMFSLQQAPFWYGPYRYVKENYIKALTWFIGSLLLIILTIWATNMWGK